LGDGGPDPTVRVTRIRTAHPDGVAEEITVASSAGVAVHVALTLDVTADLAAMDRIRGGAGTAPVAPRRDAAGLAWEADDVTVRLDTDGDATAGADAGGRVRWAVKLGPRESATRHWRVRVRTDAIAVIAARGPVEWSRPAVTADD